MRRGITSWADQAWHARQRYASQELVEAPAEVPDKAYRQLDTATGKM